MWLGLGIGLAVVLGSFWVAGIVVAAWLAALLVFAYAVGVAGQVYRAALFVYATEGVVPGPFDQTQMDTAWKVKSGRRPLP